MNYISPASFHNKTMNYLDKVAHSRTSWPNRTPRMIGANIVAIGTGVSAALAELLKLTLIQPAGLLLNGGLRTVRVITCKEFGESTLKQLPGTKDWLKSVQKTLLLTTSSLLSLMATVGSLVSSKPSQWNSSLQQKAGLYEKEKTPDINGPILGRKPFLRYVSGVFHAFAGNSTLLKVQASLQPKHKKNADLGITTQAVVAKDLARGVLIPPATIIGGDNLEDLQKAAQAALFEETTGIFNGDPIVLYTPRGRFSETTIVISNSTSIDAARKLAQAGQNPALQNLANRESAGGSKFSPFSGSQEESLIHSSNLLWHIDRDLNPEFSRILREKNMNDYHIPAFGALYSAGVKFHTAKGEPDFQAAVISTAAPDLRPGSREMEHLDSIYGKGKSNEKNEGIKFLMTQRIVAGLVAAVQKGHTHLILGAAGCGAFRNEATAVATIYKELLEGPFSGHFKYVEFAILEDRNGNHEKFKTVLGETATSNDEHSAES